LEPFALNQIGLVYKKLRQYERALQIFQQSLSKPSFEGQNILNNIGLVYFERGEYYQALKSYQQALNDSIPNTGDPSTPGFILNSIGSVNTQLGDYAQALETYRQALALFRELNNRPGERLTLSNIGALLEKQSRPELAIAFYKEAVNITEAIRQDLQKLTIEEQKAYTETVASTYRSLADLLLSQGRILEAQQVLELLKVQELRDFTKDTRTGGENVGIAANSTEAEVLETHGSLITLGRKIEECQKTQCEQISQLLDQREVIAKEFEENVRSLEQDIRSRRANDKAFLDPNTIGGNADEIVSAQPGTVLIYPLVLEDKLWILWAAQGGITKSIEVPQVGLKQLSETVVRFRQLLQNPNSDLAELKATGKQLYNWLIPQSLQKELKENQIQNLVFSLDHVTRYIPMSAVFDGENT
jgi:Tfp pilus assembly protein PilF